MTPRRNPSVRDALALRRQVALSFPVAFLAHDLEEVLASGWWQRRAPELIRRRFPAAPDRLVAAVSVPPRQMTAAVGVVLAGVLAATAEGLRDVGGAARGEPGRGQMRLFQTALAAYTAHGVTHLAAAAGLRSYVPGVLTVPLVIAPYSAWAWRMLRASGLAPDGRRLALTLAAGGVLAVPMVAAAQLIGRATARPRPARPAPRQT